MARRTENGSETPATTAAVALNADGTPRKKRGRKPGSTVNKGAVKISLPPRVSEEFDRVVAATNVTPKALKEIIQNAAFEFFEQKSLMEFYMEHVTRIANDPELLAKAKAEREAAKAARAAARAAAQDGSGDATATA